MPQAIPDSVPKEFLERLDRLFGQDTPSIMKSFQTSRAVVVRYNPLRTTEAEVESLFSSLQLPFIQLPFYDKGYILPTLSDKRRLTDQSLYTEGKLYIQGASSMIPALVMDPQPSDTLLDMAAAPGSKTSLMAILMQNQGCIIANDSSRERSYKLKSNLAQQQITNTQIFVSPGHTLQRRFPMVFDKVLVDAPCSMEGRFDFGDAKSYADWSLHKVHDLALRQRGLLGAAFACVRVGGSIVYSTCTLAPEENEEVINWFVTRYKTSIEIVPVECTGAPFINGLTQWKEKKYHPDLIMTKRVNPSETMEGFYIAKLRRLA